MQQCTDCKLILDDDVRFCPNCGREVADRAATETDPRVRLSVLLTSANLHRVKREWDQAITDATEALRLEPSNAEVASLLASIYEQRGDLDEASVWYKIALDLDPQSSSDRARLRRVSQQLTGAAPTIAADRKWDRNVALIVTVAFVVIAIGASALILSLKRSAHNNAKAPVHTMANPDQARPVRIPMTSTATGANQVRSTGATPLSGSSGAAGRATRTAAETAIRVSAGGSDAVRAANASIDDVIGDPRQGLVTVTFSVPATGAVTRSGIIIAAAAVARAAFAQNAEVRVVTTRCVVGSRAATGAQIAFVGDVSRSAVQALADNAAPQQLVSAFVNTWWNPQIGDR